MGRTDLRDANLFRADLQEADLFRADLRGAFLMQVNMDSVYLLALRIDGQTDLAEVHWGRKYINEWERIELDQNARASYRQLNTWYQNHGYSDIAGEFHYREWVCKRLEAQGRLARRVKPAPPLVCINGPEFVAVADRGMVPLACHPRVAFRLRRTSR